MTAILAVTLSLSLVVTFGALSRSVEQRVRERLTRAVREIAFSAELSGADRDALSRRIVERPAVRQFLLDPSPTLQSAALQALDTLRARRSPQLAVELWDAEGRPMLYLPGAPAVAQRPGPALLADSIVATPMFRQGADIVFWSIVPVHEGKRVVGYLGRQVRIASPVDAVRKLRELTGEDVSLYMRNADGHIWVQPPGKSIEPPLRTLGSGSDLFFERAGIGRTIGAESLIAGSPWIAVLEAPAASSVTKRVLDTMIPLAIASAMLIALGTLISWLIARRITRPLVLLSHAAGSISHGDYAPRVHVASSDEVGVLAARFNRMAAEIEAARRELEQRVTQAQLATQDSDRLRAEAERANRAKSDFLAVMSHELRTPLNAIAGYAQLLESEVYGPVLPQQRDALIRITRNQEHLLALINDILNYAKLDAGRVNYTISSVPVNELLEGLEALVGPQVRAKQIIFAVRPTAVPLTVRADRDKLQQIVLNLLTNAIKFTPAGGSILVEARGAADRVHISVRDTGIGIPRDRLHLIFDPFVQIDRALNRPGEGVGLGLAISRDLATGMGGELSVSSVIGEGSVFTITLPSAVVTSSHTHTQSVPA